MGPHERLATFEPGIDTRVGCWTPAVVAFAWSGEGFVLARIPGRGWCTPSGRVKAGESATEAAVRETREEIGGKLEDPLELGRYRLTAKEGAVSYIPAFLGRVVTWGAVPSKSESEGVLVATRDQLKSCYYHWDELLDRVFTLAESTSRSWYGGR